MNKINAMIRATNGRIFSAVFDKKDGSMRAINARLSVTKGLTGKGLAFNPESKGLIPVYDINAKGYRMLNTRTLRSFKCGSVVWARKA